MVGGVGAERQDAVQRVAVRAQIVLGAAAGQSNNGLAKALGISRPTLLRWRERYVEAGVTGLLKDAPRPGRRKRIRPEKVEVHRDCDSAHDAAWSPRTGACGPCRSPRRSTTMVSRSVGCYRRCRSAPRTTRAQHHGEGRRSEDGDTGEAIKDYTVDKKNEAVAHAKKLGRDIDVKIKELDAHASKQTGEAKAKSREMIKDLTAKRAKVSAKLSELSKATKASWAIRKKPSATPGRIWQSPTTRPWPRSRSKPSRHPTGADCRDPVVGARSQFRKVRGLPWHLWSEGAQYTPRCCRRSTPLC